MNEQPKPLSGEKALDDYFADLLAETVGESSSAPEEQENQDEPSDDGASTHSSELDSPVPNDTVEQAKETGLDQAMLSEPAKEDMALCTQPEPSAQQRLPELEPVTDFAQPDSYSQRESDFVPNLEDVERLLGQLQVMNHSALDDIDELIEKNTVEIKLERQETPAPSDPLLTTEVEQPQVAQDEIQSWDIDSVPVEPTVIETQPEVNEEQQDTACATASVTESLSDTAFSVEEQQWQASEMPQAAPQAQWQSTQRDVDFQVLYFDVNQVTFAVPLDELGGIHQLGELNHLIGRPKWYLGLQTNKDQQLDVVDTAKWVMADKLVDDSYKENYQYIVMLGESQWGLAASQLMGTELLSTDQINWRTQAGKRPWLAGMVKEKMCALIHVEELIVMLKAGLDVKSLN